MSTQISEDNVNTVKQGLLSFLEHINKYSVEKSHPEFHGCIRSCVALFFVRKTYDYGPNVSGEYFTGQKQIPHQEAIQKIKENVIPFLNKANSHLPQDSQWRPDFLRLYNSIQAFFPEKQPARTGPSESHRQRMRDLLDELRRLLELSDV